MIKYKGWIIAGISLAAILFLIIVPLFSYANQDTELRNGVKASQLANKVVFDKVWKTIAQQAQISDKYAGDFRVIYKEIMEARNPEGQAKFAKFLKEAEVKYDSSLMKTLMTTVEANRMAFQNEQKSLIDRSREHNNLLEKYPSGFYLALLGRKPIEITLITSTRTEEAAKSGKDDDIDLYKSNK